MWFNTKGQREADLLENSEGLGVALPGDKGQPVLGAWAGGSLVGRVCGTKTKVNVGVFFLLPASLGGTLASSFTGGLITGDWGQVCLTSLCPTGC